MDRWRTFLAVAVGAAAVALGQTIGGPVGSVLLTLGGVIGGLAGPQIPGPRR